MRRYSRMILGIRRSEDFVTNEISTTHRRADGPLVTEPRSRRKVDGDEFLKNAGVYLDYTEDDLEQDVETHRKQGILPDR
jgi:hypothetical protein